MRATGSIRMAMRWPFSDGRSAPLVSAESREPRAESTLALLMFVVLLAGCVTTTTRAFLPDSARERMSLAEAQDALDQLVAAECPRLTAARRDLGEARISVDVDGGGQVTKSTLSKPFGDDRMDQIFGGVTAQMRFDAPSDGKAATGRMRVGYACGPNARAATIELVGQTPEP